MKTHQKFFAALTLLSLVCAGAFADRGRGSIRAAAAAPRSAPRPEPARVAPPADRRDVHAEPSHVNVQVHVDAPARRDWDDNDEDARHFGGFSQGVPVREARGTRIHDLPPTHFRLHFGDHDYFLDDAGLYYLQQPDGEYLVIQPPVGVVITAVPSGTIPIIVGPTTYYYLDGIFYVPQSSSFAVVNPPPGIVVPTLPSDSSQIVVNGNVVYQYNGFNYQPSLQDGVTVYTVTPA